MNRRAVQNDHDITVRRGGEGIEAFRPDAAAPEGVSRFDVDDVNPAVVGRDEKGIVEEGYLGDPVVARIHRHLVEPGAGQSRRRRFGFRDEP